MYIVHNTMQDVHALSNVHNMQTDEESVNAPQLQNTLPRIAYSPKEIAQMVGVSEGKITRDLRDGVLKGIRIGRQWRVRTEAFDAYLGRGAVATQETSTA